MSNPEENMGAQSPNQAPNDEIARLLPALRALAKSVEKQMYSGMTEGTGALAVRQYRALHGRIAALLPDDYYITSVLALEGDVAGEPGGQQADDQAMIAQTHLLLQQLVTYLNQIAPPQRANVPPGTPPGVSNAGGGWQNFGRELNEQIAQLTRNTVRRALESIDFTVPHPPDPPNPPGPSQHVNVSGGSVFVQPPVPPTPPTPPMPPNRPPNSPSGRIHVRVENGEDVFEREFPARDVPPDVPFDVPPRGVPPQGVPPRDVPPPDVLFWRGNPPPTEPPGDDEVV